MNSYTRKLIAALIASGTVTLALAQGTPIGPDPNAVRYVEEPIASTSGGTGPNAELANTIAAALNADASLKQSKLTVVSEENGILITGVTPTVAQMGQAMKLAGQHAGGATVSGVIATEEVLIDSAGNTPPAVATLSVTQPSVFEAAPAAPAAETTPPTAQASKA